MVPSYGLAQRAHWVILAGIGLLGVVALAGLPFVRMEITVGAPGVIEPVSVWEVRPVEPGLIVDIRVRAGDSVTVGFPLMWLDRSAAHGTGGKPKRVAVLSPARGVVLTENLDRKIGEFVRVGDEVLEIADLSRWQAVLFVSEREAQEVMPGQRATVEIPGLKLLDGRQLDGRVTVIGRQFTPREADARLAPVGTLPVIVALDSVQIVRLGANGIRRGYTARGRIVERSDRVSNFAMSGLREWANEHRR